MSAAARQQTQAQRLIPASIHLCAGKQPPQKKKKKKSMLFMLSWSIYWCSIEPSSLKFQMAPVQRVPPPLVLTKYSVSTGRPNCYLVNTSSSKTAGMWFLPIKRPKPDWDFQALTGTVHHVRRQGALWLNFTRPWWLSSAYD